MCCEFKFKNKTTFEQRIELCSRIRLTHPDRIPVIIEYDSSLDVEESANTKFLVPNDSTVQKFMISLRKKLSVTSEKGLYLHVNRKTIPRATTLIANLYKTHKDDDGFLYIVCSGENTFG